MRSFRLCICTLCTALIMASCGIDRLQSSSPATASIYALVADPAKFDGQEISVIGFLQVRPEAVGLFANRESARHGDFISGVWVSGRNEIDSKLDGQWVCVKGKFVTASRGHYGAYCGTLKLGELYSLEPPLLGE